MSENAKTKAAKAKAHQSHQVPSPSKVGRVRIYTGVVHHYLHPDRTVVSIYKGWDLNEIIERVQTGLPAYELDDLQASLAVPNEALGPMLGVSRSTINRIKGKGRESRLDPTTSDKVVRFARLMGKAVNVFGNQEDARKWLSSPQFGLGGAVPFDYAITELGAREVENLLGRIEHGVYS